MRALKAILSSICAIIIVFCSIAQFHHHDENGKMVIFSCMEQICNNDQHHSHEGIAHRHCSHGCNDGHHQDEKNCSLKINIAKPEKKNINQIIISCTIIADILNDFISETNEYFHVTDTPLRSHGNISSCGLRAPPTV